MRAVLGGLAFFIGAGVILYFLDKLGYHAFSVAIPAGIEPIPRQKKEARSRSPRAPS
jgi:hypothetical protein